MVRIPDDLGLEMLTDTAVMNFTEMEAKVRSPIRIGYAQLLT